MTVHRIPEKRSTKGRTAPLTIGALGTAGVVALYFLIPGFQLLELVLLLVAVGLAALGSTQNIIRGIATGIILYIATGVGATFYRELSYYVSGIMQVFKLSSSAGGNVDYDALALSFVLLTAITWVALEALSRNFFRDTSLPALGILDGVGSTLIYLIIGILVAALLFNTIGYSWRGRRAHDKALLRSRFNQVLRLHYNAQSFWFPRKPPIYVYDLDLQA